MFHVEHLNTIFMLGKRYYSRVRNFYSLIVCDYEQLTINEKINLRAYRALYSSVSYASQTEIILDYIKVNNKHWFLLQPSHRSKRLTLSSIKIYTKDAYRQKDFNCFIH